ncbi:hypothetical protein S40293_01495 [Stachybotrys chartarum IBT 40293]|nr:hypothetical protein S40293_01495 [Stachybotrys chartarum IBT 40293]
MAAALDPIQTAFASAVVDFRLKLNDEKLYNKILETRSLDSVYATTDALQAEQGKEGRLRHLSKAQPYLERLRSYTSVIDTFVQVQPDILALIWGPIKLLLQWASTLSQSLDAIVDMTAEIGELLPEFKEMAIMFHQNQPLKHVLVLFFQDILDIYLIALKFFSMSRWRYFFESVWPKQKDKIKVVAGHVERHTTLMRTEVRLENIRLEYDIRQRTLEHFEKTHRSNRQQDYNVIKTDILPKFYDDKLNWIHGRVCEGTGYWLLRDDMFNKWLDFTNTSTKMLWLQGIPGAGKTFLAGIAIDKAMTLHRTVFTFLSHAHAGNTTALTVLHSLIFQLTAKDDDLQEVLCQSSCGNLKNNLGVAAGLLKTILSCAGPIYLIIDGLDEIEEIERRRLLGQIADISKACQETRILISSRAEDDIARILDPVSPAIRVDGRNAGSIQAYINNWAREWFLVCDFLPRDKAEILGLLAPLSSKTKGMFLYAQIMLSSIELLHNVEDIRQELKVLPENLDEAYGRIFRRINSLHSSVARSQCRSLLGWISCSPTPLTIQELEQALVVSSKPNTACRVSSSLNLVRLCGPIVEIVDNYVQFVHFTVQEYINSPNIENFIDIAEATLSLSTCCIYYLCQSHHCPWIEDEELQECIMAGDYRLHYYAVSTWLELVDRYLGLKGSNSPSEDLICALDKLHAERGKWGFEGGTELEGQQFPKNLQKLESRRPDLFRFLRDVGRFKQRSSTSRYRLDEVSRWTAHDPLITSDISKLLYEKFDQFVCKAESHREECYCDTLQRHYGQLLFKCSFMGCLLHRRGFSTWTSRQSHIKHHGRPWKCDVGSCQYAEIGFLSKRMRDEHSDLHGTEGRSTTNAAPFNPNIDELQPLIFDLVRSDDFEAVRKLLPLCQKLDKSVQAELQTLASYSGSAAMLETLSRGILSSHLLPWVDLTSASIESRNIETLNWLITQAAGRGEGGSKWPRQTSKRYSGSFRENAKLLSDTIASGSTEVFEEVEPYIIQSCKAQFADTVPAVSTVLSYNVIKATARCSNREDFLLKLWRTVLGRDGEPYPIAYLGDALGYVAQTTFSVRLAETLLHYGAKVNGRRGAAARTPLHCAVRQSSAEAAELIKFLLYQGADADTKMNHRRQIRFAKDEKGAIELSKWLGMSWEELVQKVTLDRTSSAANASM